jgi:hypothetical protein
VPEADFVSFIVVLFADYDDCLGETQVASYGGWP